MSSPSSAIGGAANGCPITVSELASSRKLSPDLLHDLDWHDLLGGGIAIPYWGMQQEGLFSRARDVPGKGRRFDQPAGVSLQPYGLWRLVEARERKCLYLCEGETDTVTLWQAGLPALGIPGANAAGCLEAAHLEGIVSLLALPDNPVREGDHSGEAFLHSLGPVLKQIDFQGKLWHVQVPLCHKDVNAWYASDPEKFPADLESAVERAEQVAFSPPSRMKDPERNGQTVKEPATPVLVQLSTVIAEPVRWLWQQWLPEGTLAVLDGDPGLGKSSLTLELATRVSRGWVMPPGAGKDLGRNPAGVLLLGAEDSLKHTVRPRLDAAGADPELIWSLEGIKQGDEDRPPSLPYDLGLMAEMIKEKGVKLVIVDPLMAFLGGEFDAHKDQDIRRCLRPMAKLAEILNVVILLIRHLNKLSGGPALYRGGSSIGISGAARASLIVGRDPNADRHILAMNKCNLAAKPPSLAYRLEPAGMGVRIAWDGEVDLTPDEILGHGPSRPRGRPDVPFQEACQFLADLLAVGPVAVKTIQDRAERGEHAWRTVEKAKAEMGILARRQGRIWVWMMPSSPIPQQPDGSGPRLFGCDTDELDARDDGDSTSDDIPFND